MIVVYTTPACPHCRALKAWLEANGIGYTEVNLLDMLPREVDALIDRAGCSETPITCIGDECRCGVQISWILEEEEKNGRE